MPQSSKFLIRVVAARRFFGSSSSTIATTATATASKTKYFLSSPLNTTSFFTGKQRVLSTLTRQEYHSRIIPSSDNSKTTDTTSRTWNPSMGSHNNHSSKDGQDDLDIEELHHQALLRGSTTYEDPTTGFTVFTELAHLKRGKCCGNTCRHCPYGWENVGGSKSRSRAAKLASGDAQMAKQLVQQIKYEASGTTATETNSKPFISSGVIHSRPNGEYPEQVPSNIESCLLQPQQEEQQKTSKNESLLSSKLSKSTSGPNKTTPSSTTSNSTIGKGGRHGGRHTSKNVPYTRGGDMGTSQLLTGERRSKADDAFEAMGTVDELCSFVGVAHAELMAAAVTTTSNSTRQNGATKSNSMEYGDLPEWLLEVMSRLFDIGSHVAKPHKIITVDDDDDDDNDDDEDHVTFTADGVGGGFHKSNIDVLEDWIDVMTEELPELSSFVLPTGAKGAAHLHVARTVCRRAERRIVPLVQDGVCDPNAMKYVNRLSDFFFTAARYVNYCENQEELQYRRDYRGAKQRQRCAVPLQQLQEQNEEETRKE